MSRKGKSLFCDHCGNPLEDDGSCKMCPAGNKRRQSPADRIDRTCPFNDHGLICGLIGSMSDTTNGQGPWYCSRHFWKLKGWPEKSAAEFENSIKTHVTVRERWYQEHGEENQPPSMEPAGVLSPMASPGLVERLRAGELGRRTREPGED